MPEFQNSLTDSGPSHQNLRPIARLGDQHRCSDNAIPTRAGQERVVSRLVRDLKPHPSYAQLGIRTPASKLNELIELGEDAFVIPLFVTSTGIVIDGYARLEVARLQGRTTVRCFEFDISEEEALRRLILCHRRLAGLPAFCRIMLALPLAKSFKEKALQNQQDGGKNKGSSKLTEAQKIDVRKKIAALAGVSVGTLSHAWEVLKNGDTEIKRALCNGEIKIDRAWRWSKESRTRQLENLKLYRRNRGMERVAEELVARHIRKQKAEPPPIRRWKIVTPKETVKELASLSSEALGTINVVVIKAPGAILALSEQIAEQLNFRAEAPQ